MKCIKNGDEVVRVSEHVAVNKVKQGWQYCTKTDWKNVKKTTGKDHTEISHVTQTLKKKKVKVKNVEKITDEEKG